MNDQQKQSNKNDLVLDDDNPLLNASILDGIERIKSCLESNNIQDKVDALTEAINYDNVGLNLIIKHLADRNHNYRITETCVELLQKSDHPQAKQALQNHAPWLFFQTFDKWHIKRFALKRRTNSKGNNICYSFEFHLYDEYHRNEDEWKRLEKFVTQTTAKRVKALAFELHEEDWNHWNRKYRCDTHLLFNEIVSVISNSKKFSHLKAFFIGNIPADRYHQYLNGINNLNNILESFPKLELLHVRANSLYYRESYVLTSVKHDYLKTLIIETYATHPIALKQIGNFHLSQLERLELWLSGGRDYWRESWVYDYVNDNYYQEYQYTNERLTTFLFDNIMTICESFPNLKYLGLRSIDEADLVLEAILDSPLIDKLLILNLSRGTLTDKGSELLLNSPAINRLYTLDVSENCLSDTMIQRLYKLNCKVIAHSQNTSLWNRYDSMQERYASLYE